MSAERKYRVAFQGELGAFSEEAIHRVFGGAADPLPCREFAEVGAAIARGEAEFGVLPIENTLAGSVVPSYDVLAPGALRVIGEVVIPIHHFVLGVPGSTLEGLERVISHPVALAQCTRFLAGRPGLQALAVYDTAGAARDVAAQADPRVAAIAGEHAAARYGLEVLAPHVEDRSDNQTRFLVVTPSDSPHAEHFLDRPAPKGMRSTLLVETDNTPGALVRVLVPLSERGINLSKLESRPTGEPWTYRFFLELDSDLSSAAAQEALAQIRDLAVSVRALGSYPRWAGA